MQVKVTITTKLDIPDDVFKHYYEGDIQWILERHVIELGKLESTYQLNPKSKDREKAISRFQIDSEYTSLVNKDRGKRVNSIAIVQKK
jgi:hypothetical protein